MADTPQAPAPAPQSQDLRGVPETVQRIQKILNAEKAPPVTQARPQEQTTAPQEAQPEAQQEPEAPAGPNKQAEGEEASEQAQEDAPSEPRRVAEIPLDQLEAIELEVTVKGEDGKDVVEKPSIKALREGYMRQKDYQRKTAEVARQREEVGNSVRQAVEGERTQYSQTLQQMQALIIETVAPELKDVNWKQLAQDNAFEYVRLSNRANEVTQALSRIQEAQQAITAKQQQEHAESSKKVVAKAREQLQAEIPGWNDTLYQSLMKTGMQDYGFKQEEVTSWTDPRVIKLLKDASEYRKMQASPTGKPSADKKVVAAPKVVRPGTVADTNPKAQRQAQAIKQLRSSGKIEDAAAVIRNRFG